MPMQVRRRRLLQRQRLVAPVVQVVQVVVMTLLLLLLKLLLKLLVMPSLQDRRLLRTN